MSEPTWKNMIPNPQKPKKYILINGLIYEFDKLGLDPNGLYDFDMMFGTKTTLFDDITELTKKTPEYDREKKDLYWEIAGLKNELKKYKDIENELGIDLATLFKALKNGIYYRYRTELGHDVILFSEDYAKVMLYFYNKSFEIHEYIDCMAPFYRYLTTVYIKDYGKTWALTKEELE